jgi:hypothetical protein
MSEILLLHRSQWLYLSNFNVTVPTNQSPLVIDLDHPKFVTSRAYKGLINIHINLDKKNYINIVFSVTYYLELHDAITIYILYLKLIV